MTALRFVDAGRRARRATCSSRTSARSVPASAAACRCSPTRSRHSTPTESPRALRAGADGRRLEQAAPTMSSTADDLIFSMAPLDGYLLEREGSHAVALELALDDTLIRAGRAREIVHAVRSPRGAGRPRDQRPDRPLARRRRAVCSQPPASTSPTSPAKRSRPASPSPSAPPGAVGRETRQPLDRARAAGPPRWGAPRRPGATSLGEELRLDLLLRDRRRSPS